MPNDTTEYTLYPEATTDERGRYFDGQFLTAQDFVDEQRYHVDRLRRFLDLFTVAGVAVGLELGVAGKWKLGVTAGAAIDGRGRLLLLSTAISGADVPKDIPGGVVEVALYYNEVESRVQGGTSEEQGTRGATRLRELPGLECYMAGGQPSHPGAVPLGRVQVAGDGTLTPVDPDPVRRYTGLRLPSSGDAGPSLRSGGPARPDLVGVFGDLGVSGKLGVGTMDPEAELDVRGTARIDQLSIRERGFRVAGDEATFYPIVFRDLAWTAGAMALEISRPNAQADAANAGSMLLALRWHAGDGQGSEFIEGRLIQTRRFVAAVKTTRQDRLLVVWLRGNRSYAWRASHRAELIDDRAVAKILGGDQLDPRAAIDPLLDRDRVQFTANIDRQVIHGPLTVNGDIAYTGALSKLDVAENDTATIRARDLLLGHTAARVKPGRALVDGGSTLLVNKDADWAVTRLGGRTETDGDLTVRGALNVQRSDGHLTLARPTGSTTGGAVVFADLVQRDVNPPTVPEVGVSLRFHHEQRFWKRIEARPTGFHLRNGNPGNDEYTDLSVNDLKLRNAAFTGAVTTDLKLGAKLEVGTDAKIGGTLTVSKNATFADNLTITRSDAHLTLARPGDSKTGGPQIFLELVQQESGATVPATYPAIRFHHTNQFWHRLEGRANGLHLRDGSTGSDAYKSFHAGDMYANALHVVTGPAERLRLIRGTVTEAGGVADGSGYSVSHEGNWLTKITFTTAFASAPSVVVTQQYPDNNSSTSGGDTRDNATVVRVEKTAVWIKCGSNSGDGQWRRFHFIAAGT